MIWFTSLGINFSGYWWGPYTLLERVMMVGSPKLVWYACTTCSAAALLAEYGLVGASCAASL